MDEAAIEALLNPGAMIADLKNIWAGRKLANRWSL